MPMLRPTMNLGGRILLLGGAAIAWIAVSGYLLFAAASTGDEARSTVRSTQAEMRSYLLISSRARELRWAAEREPPDLHMAADLRRDIAHELAALAVLRRHGPSPSLEKVQRAFAELERALDQQPVPRTVGERFEALVASSTEAFETEAANFRDVDEAEAFLSHRTTVAAVGLPVAAAAMILGLAFALLVRLRARVEDLLEGAERLAQGENHRIPEVGGDELAQVAAAVNSMGARLLEANHDLEARVRARTAELESSRMALEKNLRELRETRDRLAGADRMRLVGTLAAGVAHEINNPLSFLCANLEFVRNRLEDRDEEVLCRALEEAEEGAERIRRIVKDLVSFCRSEEPPAPLAVEEIVEEAIRMAGHELKPYRLSKDLAKVPWVRGNRSHLGQVFLNLLVNAAQALERHPDGEIRVAVQTDAAGNVVVEVEDRGCGIPESIRDRIFDPFFTTRAVGDGKGLGLSVCSGIVTGHGGTIEWLPGREQGSLFRVTLPALETAGAVEARMG